MSDLRDPPRWLESRTLAPDVRKQLTDYANAGPSGERRARMLARIEQEVSAAQGEAAGGSLMAEVKSYLFAGAMFVGTVTLTALLWPAPPLHSPGVVAPAAPTVVWERTVAPALEQLPAESERIAPVTGQDDEQVRSRLRMRTSSRTAPQLVRKRAVERPAADKQELSTPDDQSPSRERVSSSAQAGDAMLELTMLAKARRALLTRPQRALELAEAHARAYPRGTFEEEREVLAIESLLRLSNVAEARARAKAFEQKFPGSSHRAHLARLVSHD